MFILFYTLVLSFCLFFCFSCNRQEVSEFYSSQLYTAKSKIHGVGVFTRNSIKKDEKILQIIQGRSVIGLGKQVNHCPFAKSNTYLKQDILDKEKWFLYALKDIEHNEELVCDYNDTPKNLIKRPEKNWKC